MFDNLPSWEDGYSCMTLESFCLQDPTEDGLNSNPMMNALDLPLFDIASGGNREFNKLRRPRQTSIHELNPSQKSLGHRNRVEGYEGPDSVQTRRRNSRVTNELGHCWPLRIVVPHAPRFWRVCHESQGSLRRKDLASCRSKGRA